MKLVRRIGLIIMVAVFITGSLAPQSSVLAQSGADLTLEEQIYIDAMAERALNVTQGMLRLSALFSEPELLDLLWTVRVVEIIVQWQLVYEELLVLTPPPRLQEFYDLELEMYWQLNSAADDIIYAIDYFDIPRLLEAQWKIEEAGRIATQIGDLADNWSGAREEPAPAPAIEQGGFTCVEFDAWEWAQSVYDDEPRANPLLDQTGDGIACPELPRGGFAPAFWLEDLPEELRGVQFIRVVDGSTLEVSVEGVAQTVTVDQLDVPSGADCGAQEAATFAGWALSFNDDPDGRIYLDRDAHDPDRVLVWWEIDGHPYLLNHVLLTTGWAAHTGEDDDPHADELAQAADFAERHGLGVWSFCGGFDTATP
jgi:endonuclease YncB( thermonuclease family)